MLSNHPSLFASLLLTNFLEIIQGMSKSWAPGCVKMRKDFVFLPAEGKQNATFLPNFTQPGTNLLEIPCTHRPSTAPVQRGGIGCTQLDCRFRPFSFLPSFGPRLRVTSWPFFLFSSLLSSRAGSKDALVQFGEKI